MKEVAKRTEAQISHITDLMTKFANQMLPSTSTPPPPPNPSPLPSQPLPNPKEGINVVEKGSEEKEKRKARTEWLIELIAKANEMVESDDEDWWDESDESDESDEEDSEDEDEEWEVEEENKVEVEVEKEDMIKEVVEKEQVNEALEEEAKIVEECGKLCLATIFEGEKVHKSILPVKCEDPRPCLVTCEERGINIPDCLCDPGACATVMPYELYCLLDLGPLRSTKDVFTTADMGIVSIAGIAEDVVVKIGSLTQRWHNSSSLRRPTLHTARFKVDYITNAFSFKVGNVEEVYHPKMPPALNKKFAHQVQCSMEDKDERRQSEEAKGRLKKSKGSRNSPPHVKKKKKDPMKKKVKIRKQGEKGSKEENEGEKEKMKLELKCKSVEDLIGKLYTFKKVLHHNDAMNHHLVKDQSKWK
ncbi:hypothetical protein PIB30_060331 [Stylosanthes scabra]|uniref:Uncharacterized protein n=1 Tax=Stylosanthes scabra TaxID=79078 RepID=A0ABU6WLP6_9FABA|nr:hypothetical protein [Stylosanthes scabra]